MSSFNYTDDFSGFNDLINRAELLTEMADTAKKALAQLAKTKDGKVGLNDLIKMYQHKRTDKSPAGSYAKNMLWLVAMADQDFITDEQKEAIKSTNMSSATAFAKAVQEIAPEAVKALYGEEQKSEDLIKFVGDNSILLLRRAIMNMPGDNFIYTGPDVEDKDLDAAVSSQKVEDDIEDVAGEIGHEIDLTTDDPGAEDARLRYAKGITKKEVEDIVLPFDDIDVIFGELPDRDEIIAKMVDKFNQMDPRIKAGRMSGGEGLNIEVPVGAFNYNDVGDQITGMARSLSPYARKIAGDNWISVDVISDTPKSDEDFEMGVEPDESNEYEQGLDQVQSDEEAEDWAKKAAASIEKKGTEGEFTKYCDGDVTQACVDRAARGKSTKRKRQAAFAANISGNDRLTYPKEEESQEELDHFLTKEQPEDYIPSPDYEDVLNDLVNKDKKEHALKKLNGDGERHRHSPMLDSYQTSTAGYLTEQAASDKRNKKPEVKNKSFKEKYKPKTHWQLQELRKYGL